MADQSHKSPDDMDLENAIGDVFKLFNLEQMNKSKDNPEPESNQDQVSSSNEDIPQLVEHHNEEQLPEKEDKSYDHKNNDNVNFDDAIKDAFQSLHESRNESVRSHDDHHSYDDHESQQAFNDDDDGKEQDLDLASAITDAIQSIHGNDMQERHIQDHRLDHHIQDQDEDHVQDQTHDQTHDHDHQHESNKDFQNTPSKPHNEKDLYSPLQMEKDQQEEEEDNLALQNAIGNAFLSLKETSGHQDQLFQDESEQTLSENHQSQNRQLMSHLKIPTGEDVDDEGLNKVISDSFHSLVNKQRSKTDDKVNINNVVSNLIGQMSNDESRDDAIISNDILQELAQEITNKVQESDDPNQSKTKDLVIPKIDDNVLNHFVNEAHKDELGKTPSSSIQTAPTTNNLLSGEQLQSTIANVVKNVIENDQKDTDMDQLQMNDILTNAFNMAMENPTELLNNLETDELRLDKIRARDNKKLSIAETLALHRSTMKNDLKPELNTQLSSVLANLSSRINNHGNESSLLSVIKQMTNFLTASNFQTFKSSQSLISIITNYKNTHLENTFINCLNLSKEYLRQNKGLNSIGLIDNVLILFGKNSTHDVLDYNFNLIALVSNSINNCISNFSTLKNIKGHIFQQKPKLNGIEDKERVRLENRERKKRWREENSERNKDNDLRARVLKKAASKFGDDSSPEKSSWIDEEFGKRKEKRLLREKKGLENKDSSNIMNEFNSNNEIFINDKNLIQLMTDLFKIFSNFSPKDDPETGLLTTSTTMSCSAIIYLLNLDNNFDFKRIDTIVTNIVNNLLNTFNSLEQQERIIYLIKGTSNYRLHNDLRTPSYPSKLPNQGLTTLINRNMDVDSSKPPNSILDKISDKIKNFSSSDDANKRLKLSPDVIRSSPMNLKFPSYKGGVYSLTQSQRQTQSQSDEDIGQPQAPSDPQPPDPSPYFVQPTIKKEFESPFLSNKLSQSSSSPSISSSGTSNGETVNGLRKPGSFRIPAYSKPRDKGKSLGFPRLYSASIKQNQP